MLIKFFKCSNKIHFILSKMKGIDIKLKGRNYFIAISMKGSKPILILCFTLEEYFQIFIRFLN